MGATQLPEPEVHEVAKAVWPRLPVKSREQKALMRRRRKPVPQ